MTEPKPWLSLPDEDPPERGLAELLAAARIKAEEMVSPPWWKRWPPMLALATVVLVLGGVIVVSHRDARKATVAPAADPLARCRAAAVRRDCAAAKACAKDLGTVDVGSDAALKSCL